jgi:hypothetical protein
MSHFWQGELSFAVRSGVFVCVRLWLLLWLWPWLWPWLWLCVFVCLGV